MNDKEAIKYKVDDVCFHIERHSLKNEGNLWSKNCSIRDFDRASL